jgi:hypothetical protein
MDSGIRIHTTSYLHLKRDLHGLVRYILVSIDPRPFVSEGEHFSGPRTGVMEHVAALGRDGIIPLEEVAGFTPAGAPTGEVLEHRSLQE